MGRTYLVRHAVGPRYLPLQDLQEDFLNFAATFFRQVALWVNCRAYSVPKVCAALGPIVRREELVNAIYSTRKRRLILAQATLCRERLTYECLREMARFDCGRDAWLCRTLGDDF